MSLVSWKFAITISLLLNTTLPESQLTDIAANWLYEDVDRLIGQLMFYLVTCVYEDEAANENVSKF